MPVILSPDPARYARLRDDLLGALEGTIRMDLPIAPRLAEELVIQMQAIVAGEIPFACAGEIVTVVLGFAKEREGAAIEIDPQLAAVTPRVVDDRTRFDRFQMTLIRGAARSAVRVCRRDSLEPARLVKTVEKATFGIGGILDGADAALIIRPVLMFRTEAAPCELIAGGGGSYMHEYASGAALDAIREIAE